MTRVPDAAPRPQIPVFVRPPVMPRPAPLPANTAQQDNFGGEPWTPQLAVSTDGVEALPAGDPELTALARNQRALQNTRRGINPIDSDRLRGAVTSAAADVMPTGLKDVDGLSLLDGVKDAHVQLEVPLKEGRYEIGGVKVTVQPNTKARVDVEVKDGKIVPVKDGFGTKMTIDPPLKGPLGITGNGTYVKGDKKGEGKLKADLGHFFDVGLTKKTNLDLGTTVRGLAAQSGKASKGSGLPSGLVDTERLTFGAGDVKLKDGRLNLGSAQVDVGPGSQLELKGDAKKAELNGHLNLRQISVKQDGLELAGGPGTADLHVSADRAADGGYAVSAKLSKLSGDFEQIRAQTPGTVGGDPDHLALAGVKLRDGTIDLATRFSPSGKSTVTDHRVQGQIEAKTADAKLSVPDADGVAELRANAHDLKTSFEVSSDRIQIDGSFRGDLEVKGLQSESAGASIDLHHAKATGAVALSVDTKEGQLSAQIDASNIDVRLDDYRGEANGLSADLARTEVQGSGKVELDSKKGLRVTGDLALKGEIDELKLHTAGPEGSTIFDLKKGSKFEGSVRSLSVDETKGFELDAHVRVDAGIERAKVELPGVRATGDGDIKGQTDLKIGGGEVRFENADAQVALNANEGTIAPGGDKLSLDLDRGSKMKLSLKQASYSAGNGQIAMDIGPGSTIDAQVSHGRLKTGDYEVELNKGTQAHLDVQGLRVSTDGQAELHGRLELEAEGMVSAHGQEGPPRDGVRVESSGTAGRTKITVEDVSMSSDGALRMRGVDVGLDAKLGKISAVSTGAAAAPAETPRAERAPAATAIDAPEGVLSAEKLKATSAAELAGVGSVHGDLDPLAIAKNLKNGTLKLSIPVEGRLGAGIKAVDFEPGTRLDLSAEVKDGRIQKLEGDFSRAGDGRAWITAKGIVLDKDQQLTAKVGGWSDAPLADLKQKDGSAPKVSDLIDALSKTEGSGGKSPFQPEYARVSLKDAELNPGTELALPIGKIKTGPATRLDVEGTPKAMVVSGKLDIERFDVDGQDFALKNLRGTADLRLEYSDRLSGKKVKTELTNLDLHADGLVHKQEGDSYLALEQLSAKGGSISVNSTMPTKGQAKTEVRLNLPEVDASLSSARLAVESKSGGRSPVELGRTGFRGELQLEGGDIKRLRGNVPQFDASITNLDLETGEGAMKVSRGRIKGDTQLDFSSGHIIATNGNLDVDAVVTQASADLLRVGLPFDRTVMANGDVRVRTSLQGFTKMEYAQESGAAGQKTRVELEGGQLKSRAKVADLYGRFLR